MYHVQSEEHLHRLKPLIHHGYLTIVSEWFNCLKDSSPCEEPGVPFVLDSGTIHVVLDGDGEECLQPLFASWPEYSELVRANDGRCVWKVVVVLDNDWIDFWFVQQEVFPELDAWAEQYLENNQY